MKTVLLKKPVILFIIFFTLMVSLFKSMAHPEAKTSTKPQIYEVQPETFHKTLLFTGTLQPLQERSLAAPMEGIIETMPKHFGEKVNKGDIIFALNSSDFQRQYNEVLTEYLKAKDNYTIAKTKFVGTKDLWSSGLISKNNYLSEKSSLTTARISMMQSSQKLSEMLEKLGENKKSNLTTLSFEEFDKVKSALTTRHNLIYLRAKETGVLLYPPKNGDNQNTHLTTGVSVKTGEVLGVIGDLSGVSVEINVPEVDIDKMKPGMEAIVHCAAFPKEELRGSVIAVNAQASSLGDSSLPSFTAVVVVKHLSPQQQEWVKVGMSASIEVHIETSNQLFVPIKAITQAHGKTEVQIQNEDGTLTSREVITGAAQVDKVIIESGLQPGEKVIYG